MGGLVDDERDRAVRERLADWYETVHERVSVGIGVEQNARGRVDTRSTIAVVHLSTAVGSGELCRVRVRDLVDQHGEPIDARVTARDLQAQLRGAPDHLRGAPNHLSALLDG